MAPILDFNTLIIFLFIYALISFFIHLDGILKRKKKIINQMPGIIDKKRKDGNEI